MIDKNLLYGTWRLVKGVSKDDADNLLPPPYGGAEAMALLSIRRDGRMISVLCDSRARIPSGEERDYTSYCGKYEFDGYTLTTRVDACSDPARLVPTKCVRFEWMGTFLYFNLPHAKKMEKPNTAKCFGKR